MVIMPWWLFFLRQMMQVAVKQGYIVDEMFHIYKITNTANGKHYFGQTNNVPLRWSQHKSNAKLNPNCQVITRAMAKYGVDKFTFEVVANYETLDEVNVAEENIIADNDARNPLKGYNIDVGGKQTPRAPEVVAKIREALLKHYETHESKNKGVPMSEEAKKNMSEAAMGKPGTNVGKTFDDEWCLKISKTNAGSEKKKLRRFTDEQELEICRLYVAEEKSTYWIGNEFKCNRNMVASILKRNKVDKRISNYTGHSNGCNKFTFQEEAEMCAEYKAGKSTIVALADKYGCGKTTMREILLRYDILGINRDNQG
jgi:group I intron endonuclease